MFIDSSALVAILASEEDGDELSERLRDARRPMTSALCIFETVLALCRIFKASQDEMKPLVIDYLEAAGIELVSIPEDTHRIALAAHRDYGKGTGHRAQLNMADCFSYALAKQQRVELLYKGDDFAHTDLR